MAPTDLVLAGVTVAVTQFAVWTGTVRGPHLPNAVLLLAVTAPVAVKSRWPVRVTVWSSLVLALQVALYGASETAGLTFTFLALAYTVTLRCGVPGRSAGLGVLLAAGLWHEARDPEHERLAPVEQTHARLLLTRRQAMMPHPVTAHGPVRAPVQGSAEAAAVAG